MGWYSMFSSAISGALNSVWYKNASPPAGPSATTATATSSSSSSSASSPGAATASTMDVKHSNTASSAAPAAAAAIDQKAVSSLQGKKVALVSISDVLIIKEEKLVLNVTVLKHLHAQGIEDIFFIANMAKIDELLKLIPSGWSYEALQKEVEKFTPPDSKSSASIWKKFTVHAVLSAYDHIFNTNTLGTLHTIFKGTIEKSYAQHDKQKGGLEELVKLEKNLIGLIRRLTKYRAVEFKEYLKTKFANFPHLQNYISENAGPLFALIFPKIRDFDQYNSMGALLDYRRYLADNIGPLGPLKPYKEKLVEALMDYLSDMVNCISDKHYIAKQAACLFKKQGVTEVLYYAPNYIYGWRAIHQAHTVFNFECNTVKFNAFLVKSDGSVVEEDLTYNRPDEMPKSFEYEPGRPADLPMFRMF